MRTKPPPKPADKTSTGQAPKGHNWRGYLIALLLFLAGYVSFSSPTSWFTSSAPAAGASSK